MGKETDAPPSPQGVGGKPGGGEDGGDGALPAAPASSEGGTTRPHSPPPPPPPGLAHLLGAGFPASTLHPQAGFLNPSLIPSLPA